MSVGAGDPGNIMGRSGCVARAAEGGTGTEKRRQNGNVHDDRGAKARTSECQHQDIKPQWPQSVVIGIASMLSQYSFCFVRILILLDEETCGAAIRELKLSHC